MQINSKGQVTIPLRYRNKYGFFFNTDVVFVPSRHGLIIKKSKIEKRGKCLIKQLKGKATSQLSTDEIIRLTRTNNDY